MRQSGFASSAVVAPFAGILEFSHSGESGSFSGGEIEQLKAKVQSQQVYLNIRRAIDILAVVFLAPVVLPIIVFAAAATAILMGRPVFIVQRRVGRDGQVFNLLKFRTMRGKPSRNECLTQPGDKRITSLGRFMRRTHFDELPQFWNVLAGDMALIGPRPEQEFLVNDYRTRLANYDLRHMVPPGLSGYAQVYYGYASDLLETSEKLKYDLFYVRNMGLRLDFQIALRTAAVFFNTAYVR